ncbi:ABC transporter permease [Actinoplanes sp. KI2]|uniref:ABC transporter permease n=1 Tax=Actinoplanes sp. KI2 TaxID=2983315 RepID=UPI0021D5D282|nr:ABC transporter permease [Actinoplanes sp. KI2]MCU7726835.1 ABC transporter permease [Actinoplanes sp. KI2]
MTGTLPRQKETPAERDRRLLTLLRTGGTVLVRWREASVLIVAIAMAIYFRASNDVFLTYDNLRNIAQATAPAAIVAVGIVLLLVSGEIDLSVGVVAALAPFLVHYAVDLWGVPVIPAFLIAFAVAALIGFCNGVIVTKFKVPSLVATLGSYYLLLGVLLVTSHAYPAEIPAAAHGKIQSIFGAADWASLIWCLGVVLVYHIVLTRTRWGLHTISVGGNLVGATEAGIRVNRIKIGNFMMAAMLGALAGILEAFRINSIDPNIGGGTALTFTAISAAVIGGTALAGGSGTVIGALLGALILAELQNGFNLIGISANPFNIILGSAILLSMIANQYLSRLRRTGGG